MVISLKLQNIWMDCFICMQKQRDFYHQTQSFFHYEWEIQHSVHAHKAEMKWEVKLCQFAFVFSVLTVKSVSQWISHVCTCPVEGILSLVSLHVCSVRASLSGGMSGRPPRWTEFVTHACENITFPQLRLRTVKLCGLLYETDKAVSAENTNSNWVYTCRWNGFVWLLWVVDGNSWAENTVFWNRKVYPLRTSLMPNLWLAMMFGIGRKSKYEYGKKHEETNSVLSRSKFLLQWNIFLRNYFFKINYLLTTIAVPNLRPVRNLLHRLFLARIIYHYYRETASNLIQLKACSHITFESTSAFQEHVKFLSTSRKPKSWVRTIPLVAIESILENANVNVTCECSLNVLVEWQYITWKHSSSKQTS